MNRSIVTWLAIACFAAFMLCAQPAAARPLPAGGMTAQEVAAWLIQQGQSAQIKPEPNATTPGAQIITSSTNGINYDIYMYQCDSGRCAALQYAAGWTENAANNTEMLTKVNQWDRDKRYLRAYINSGGDVFAEYDIDIDPGGTYEALDHSLTRWSTMIGLFKTYLNP